MANIDFYDVKQRKKVSISLDQIEKTQYQRKLKSGQTQTRYAFRAKTQDGRNLTKFCSQKDWETAQVKEA